MRRLLIPFLLTGTLLAACGGGGANVAAKSAAPAKPASPVVALGANHPSGGATSTTSPPTFSGNSGSSWCDFDRSLENSTKFQNLAKDPHAWVAAVNSLIPQVEAKAPSAIKADIYTLAGVIRAFMQAVVAANYDFAKINTAQLAGLADAKFTAASERITAYDKQVCGTKG